MNERVHSTEATLPLAQSAYHTHRALPLEDGSSDVHKMGRPPLNTTKGKEEAT